MCHRLRQCVEVPLDVREQRRRQLYAAVHPLPAGAGPARYGVGVRRGPRRPGQPHLYVPAPGKARPQVGRVRRVQPHRQHCADGLLHGGHRVDLLLFCKIPHRQQRRFRLCPDDRRPKGQRNLSFYHSAGGIFDFKLQPAGRAGAGDQGHDDRPAGADAGAGGPQPDLFRCGRGAALLPGAGLFCYRRLSGGSRHEPGVFLAVRRHGRHGHLRQLHWQRPQPDGRIAACHLPGHLRSSAGRHHHLPGLLHLRSGSHCRAKPAV